MNSTSDATDRTILVAGATGHQGGAVARALLDRGFSVRGLTRDPSQPAARTLEDRGAEMVRGDLYEPETLEPLVADAHGVFCVSDFWSEGYAGQIRQATNLARVSAEGGVEHFVVSGVAGSDRATGVPHFDSCDRIESNVRDFGLPHTFLRPVFFTQNFESFREDILSGTLALPIAEDTVHQVFDLTDIGTVAARVYADPGRYVGRAFELAGDEGTLKELADVFADVVGRNVDPSYVPIEDAREALGEESAAMCEWFIEDGFEADIEAIGEEFGPLTTLREYLEREDWNQDRTRPAAVTNWAMAVVTG